MKGQCVEEGSSQPKREKTKQKITKTKRKNLLKPKSAKQKKARDRRETERARDQQTDGCTLGQELHLATYSAKIEVLANPLKLSNLVGILA